MILLQYEKKNSQGISLHISSLRKQKFHRLNFLILHKHMTFKIANQISRYEFKKHPNPLLYKLDSENLRFS